MFRSLCQHAFVAHVGNDSAYIVCIDERGVAHDGRTAAEDLFYLARHLLDIKTEALLIGQTCKAVGVWLCEEFDTAGLVQLLETLYDLGGVHLKLFHTDTGDGECDFEAWICLQHLVESVEGWDV